MKNICYQMNRKAWLAILLMVMAAFPALAQKIVVTGTVYEPDGLECIGASVAVAGQTNMGVVTDADGRYRIEVAPDASLVFSYVGMASQTIAVEGRTTIDVKFATNAVALQEVVAIGYGTVKKTDATGAVGVVKPTEIEAGLASTAQDLLVGASPGVVVSTDGGGPYGKSSIQIRGGASLKASNEPLYVVDGVAMDGNTVKGGSNPLALIAPDNIESMSILKSASATAIYGSRASNGVIIITTKKGKSGRPQVNFTANMYVNTPRNYLDMMDGNEFRNFIKGYYGEDSQQAAALYGFNTDWQKEVLNTTVSQDYNLSVGGTVGVIPYRVAVGYTDNNGIVRGTSMERVNGSINLTPKFFDDLLSVNANVKGAYVRNNYEQGALGAAVSFNPTLPIHTLNKFNNWTTYISNGQIAGPTTPGTEINTLQARNPVSLIEDYYSKSNVYQSVGNLQLDLKMPFLRELRANLNLGYDYSHGENASLNTAMSPNAWAGGFTYSYPAPTADNPNHVEIVNVKQGYGQRNKELQRIYKLQLEFYMNYNKEFEAIKSALDVTAGYSWEKFRNDGHNFSTVDPAIANAPSDITTPWVDGTTRPISDFAGYQYTDTYYYSYPYNLVSFFGRVNYSFMDRYLLTATIRRDGSSRFSEDNRWGTFPSVAVAWRIIDEDFMEGVRSVMNDLKIRFDYGITGQQDLPGQYFPYLPVYVASTSNTQRYPVDGVNYVYPVFPDKYNTDLKWEETTTYNIGLDFAFLNNRFNGSIELYKRKTKDLLTEANYPAGSNLSNTGTLNLGDLENKGIEFNINTRPIVTDNFRWSSNLNVAWNMNEITRLAEGGDSYTGGIGNGVNIQQHVVGEPAYSFLVYEQVYDANGNPLEGVFVDQNGDGEITDQDKILYHHVHPDVTLSWNNTFNYKNWDLGFSLRGAFGNWAYNKNQANNSFISATATVPLSNLMNDTYLFESTRDTQLLTSSYFVQNASFVRCDNITLGYTWPELFNDNLRLRLYGAVQNPFVITKYKGLDPELTFRDQQGLDNSVYPRPITFTLGLIATF